MNPETIAMTTIAEMIWTTHWMKTTFRQSGMPPGYRMLCTADLSLTRRDAQDDFGVV